MSDIEKDGESNSPQPETAVAENVIVEEIPEKVVIPPPPEEKKIIPPTPKEEKAGFFATYGLYIIIAAVAVAALYIYSRSKNDGK